MSENVTVIIVSHFSADDLARCLPSIPDASLTPTPTIVIDNATSDNSVERVVSQFPNVELMASTANRGYGGAVNEAARNVTTEWILIANPDTEFHQGSIDALVTAAVNEPRLGSAGPKILNDDGSVYPSARAFPSFATGAGHALFHWVWPRNPWSRSYLQSASITQATKPTPTGWLSGACVLVKTQLFRQIGGFDPRFFMYFEDVDLGERLHHEGYVNLYVPDAVVTHVGGQATRRYSKRMRRVHHRSAYLYLAKRYSAWYFLPLRVALFVGLGIRNTLGL